MKNFKSLFYIGIIFFLVAGCSDDDDQGIVGSVDGNNLEVVAIEGTISTTESFVLTGQKVPITFTLPRAFKDTVTVEITSLSDGGKRARTYIVVPANQTTVTDEANAANSTTGRYEGSVTTMFLSGIALNTVEPGLHYLLSSNVLSLQTGDTSIPATNTTKFQVKLAWFYPGASNANILSMQVDRPNASTVTVSNANSAGTTVTVPSTNGILPGMLVKVTSGTGAFAQPTTSLPYVLSVNSETSLTLSVAPATALNNATIDVFGNDVNLTGASNGTGADQRKITVASTAGLVRGMVVAVSSGTGRLAANALVVDVTSPTEFTVANNPTAALSGATIMASYPDAYPGYISDIRVHDILTAGNRNLPTNSTPEGDYVFKISPSSLVSGTTSLPYRLVVVYPTGEVKILNGVYNGIATGSPYKDVLKVTKTGTGDSAVFTIENLNP